MLGAVSPITIRVFIRFALAFGLECGDATIGRPGAKECDGSGSVPVTSDRDTTAATVCMDQSFYALRCSIRKLEGRTDSEDFGVIERVIVGLVGLGPAFPV